MSIAMSNPDISKVDEIRSRFPYFSKQSPTGAYLDTAASALKLDVAISRLTEYLSYEHANIHRGAYQLSARATELYEAARSEVREYFNLPSGYQVVFTAGATDGINLVAGGAEGTIVTGGDSVVSTLLEHHSNFVPWQELCKRVGATFDLAEITQAAEIDISSLLSLIREKRPKIVACTAQSNAFGTVPKLDEVFVEAKKVGAKVLIDATQIVVHDTFNFKACPADFLVLSAHKLYGPTGLGILIGKEEALEELRPVRTGGGMIQRVTQEETTFATLPARLEAGTPPIGEGIAFGATLTALSKLQEQFEFSSMENELFSYALEKLREEKGVRVIGPDEPGAHFRSIISFQVEGVHPHDFATVADSFGVQVRAGHHCVMPAMTALGIPSTIRMSLGLYSRINDVNQLLEAVRHSQKVFQ